jgi:hypothetical protein
MPTEDARERFALLKRKRTFMASVGAEAKVAELQAEMARMIAVNPELADEQIKPAKVTGRHAPEFQTTMQPPRVTAEKTTPAEKTAPAPTRRQATPRKATK